MSDAGDSARPLAHLLFVSGLDETVASHRFRVLKLAPALRKAGLTVDVLRYRRWSAGPELGRWLARRSQAPRLVVFQKTRHPLLARLARRAGAALVMDLDDGGRQRIDGTPFPEAEQRAQERWTRRMDAAVVSCPELRDWIRDWSRRTFLIPTCLDVQAYLNLPPVSRERCTIGWVGGNQARIVLPPIQDALAHVVQTCGARVLAVGAHDPGLRPEVGCRFERWRLELEPQIFGEIDVGIMPLPDNERARMKAGFKLLQYMAAGRPVVATPIGVNREIVKPGWNGFLAATPDEWRDALVRLARAPELRAELGRNGRRFVREHYPLERAAHAWRDVCAELGRGGG